MDDWVSIKDDLPQLGKGRKRVSIDINILLDDGSVIDNGFCTVDDGKFWDSNGKHVPSSKVKGWQTR